MPDEDLMIQYSSGNTIAFNEIYFRYKDRMLYYFFRMLGNSNEKALDFVQELFLKLAKSPERFDTNRKFCTWFFSVAHNMCKNEYRRLEVRKIEQTEADTDVFDETDNYIPYEKIAEKIFEQIEMLDDTHKTVFILRFREGFTIEEISEILDISAGTVKSRLFYTRKLLYHKLNKYYHSFIEEYLN